MKSLIELFLDIPLDVVVGLATYYICTVLAQTSNNFAVILSLIVTAIFAEVFEIRIKNRHTPKE